MKGDIAIVGVAESDEIFVGRTSQRCNITPRRRGTRSPTPGWTSATSTPFTRRISTLNHRRDMGIEPR